jgi:hypothetical protein
MARKSKVGKQSAAKGKAKHVNAVKPNSISITKVKEEVYMPGSNL